MTDFLPLLAGFVQVVLVDLVLAGDNAVVIGMAARGLPAALRRRAIILGSLAAVVLRLVFAAAVTFLLRIPLLEALGGVLLLWIAWKLAAAEREHGEVAAADSVWQAVRLIVVADVIMSLDNVLALVGVSGQHLGLLAAGLALTIPLIVWGSTLISALLERWQWLLFVGVAVLGWAAFEMILEDAVVHRLTAALAEPARLGIRVAGTALLVAATWFAARRPQPAGEPGPSEG